MLRLELAAMLDMTIIVSTTYALEGDRLEILITYERVEALRSLGRAIKAKQGAHGCTRRRCARRIPGCGMRPSPLLGSVPPLYRHR